MMLALGSSDSYGEIGSAVELGALAGTRTQPSDQQTVSRAPATCSLHC